MPGIPREATNVKALRRLHLGGAALLLALCTAAAVPARTVVDGAGRSVELAVPVQRIVPAGPPADLLVFAAAPGRMLGWSRAPRESGLALLPERYRDLPEVGRLTGRGGGANLEAVLAARPDVIVDYGSTRGTFVDLADRVQAQTGIPYLLVDGSFDRIAESLRLLGSLLDLEAQTAPLAAYAERTEARVAEVRAAHAGPAPSVYYARGSDGLETGMRGSINTELLEVVGARNVAPPGNRLVRVSMEQLLAFDPDLVIALDDPLRRRLLEDPLWQGLRAVREGRVYAAPDEPVGWFDRPPSVNRLLGVHWLLARLYPETAAQSLAEETRRFFALFYHREPTAAELARLLGE